MTRWLRLAALLAVAVLAHWVATGSALAQAAVPFEAPPPGGLTWGVAGTTDLEALVAAQTFDVAAAFVLDTRTGRFLRYIPGAPARVNTLTPDRLTAETVVILRRSETIRPSPLEYAQVVSFYGRPGVPAMGVLGTYESPLDAAREVERTAAAYDALNGGRPTLAAFHLVVAVAQRSPGADGSYLGRMSTEQIREYVDVARERGMLVFLDVQVGWAEPVDEVRRLAPFLEEPFVHVALDPEFATKPEGVAPGLAVGTLDAGQINAVQDWLAEFVRAHDLPSKILVLHQFREDMLDQPEDFAPVDGVELLIDMDGFGPRAAKLSKYDLFALSDYAERGGIKLFFDWDVDLLQPADVQSLRPPPDLVIYQ